MNTKIRAVPFGYKVVFGQIVICEAEATEVKRVFCTYQAGSSFTKIAEDLTNRRVMYLPSKYCWDKGRVKRLLENTRYIGTEDFPPLISEDVFVEVNRLIKAKSFGKRETPKELLMLQGKLECAECKSALRRYLTHKRDAFICKNPQCKTGITLQQLKHGAAALIDIAIQQDTLHPACEKGPDENTLSQLQAAFKEELKNPVPDENKAKSIVYEYGLCAYENTTCPDVVAESAVQRQLHIHTANPVQTLASISQVITVDKDKRLCTTLLTGKKICGKDG